MFPKRRNVIKVKPKMEKNCRICSLIPYIMCVSTLRHTDNSPHFIISKYSFLRQTFYGLIMLGFLAIYFYVITNYSMDKYIRLELIAESILCLKGFLTLAFSNIRIRIRLKELNGWNELLRDSKRYGIPSIITSTWVRTMKIRTLIDVFLTVLFISIYTYFRLKHAHGLNLTWFDYVRKVSCIISISVQLLFVSQIVEKCVLVGMFFKRHKDLIVAHLSLRMNEGLPPYLFINEVFQAKSCNLSLVQMLRLLTRFHSAVSYNLRLLNEFLNPFMLLWILCIIAILIINTYLLIMELKMGVHTTPAVALEIETLIIIMCILFVINNIYCSHTVVSS